MLKNILNLALKGKYINTPNQLPLKLDVGRIESFNHTKRLFKITDREYDYTMYINYYDPKERLHMAPRFGIGTGGISMVYSFFYNVDLYQTVKIRYKTLEDINDDIQNIKIHQEKLEKIRQKLEKLADD